MNIDQIRFGLCCIFKEEPIKFRITTAANLAKKENPKAFIRELVDHNCKSLLEALRYCAAHGIGAFRIISSLFPLYTHPEMGYELDAIPPELEEARRFAEEKNIRLTMHPDQFVVLNSPREEVVESSIAELEYHGLIAEWVGVDVITLHAGGVYGDKKAAMDRFTENFSRLSERVRKRLALENDDKSYSPEEILALCDSLKIPFIYDVHHHRCLPDTLSIEEATKRCVASWKNREPLLHISSPHDGWEGKNPEKHHAYIAVEDFPDCWFEIGPFTLEVEAKDKELAVLRLMQQLSHKKSEDFPL